LLSNYLRFAYARKGAMSVHGPQRRKSMLARTSAIEGISGTAASRLTPTLVTHLRHRRTDSDIRRVWNVRERDHSGLAPANLTTLAHFSVSSAISLPKSAGESATAVA